MEICKICGDSFNSGRSLLEHFEKIHLSQIKDIPCLMCEKSFKVFDDLMHHMELEHKGIDSDLLEYGTEARETKKHLGNYIDETKKGVGMECPECFEMFPDVEKINDHTKKEHNKVIDPKFMVQMQKTINNASKTSQICQRCNNIFLGVVFTRIDNQILNVCLNCYEEYFGKNALTRLTIGTNEDILQKMRIPLP